MNIWIDLTNSPHVNFFSDMIKAFQQNHNVLLTCRPLANTIELLDLEGFSYHVVGKHYGQSKLKKIIGFPIRVFQLFRFLAPRNIDAAISHSSFYSPIVARMLKARCVYLNDNEHAAGNRISFLFADRIMVPEFLDLNKVRRQWARSEKIIQYPGVKEGVYLWDYRPSASIDTQKSQTNKKVIFLRPEPWTAQYYKGECNFIDELLLELKGRYNIVLLPRGDIQKEYYKQGKFSGITVSEKSISLPEIMENCGLFIGAGGTMTREAAVLGVPTISIYQDELLDVDRFLIEKGAMVHKKNLTAVDVLDFLERARKNTPDTELMRKGKEAYDLISATLLNP